MSQALREISARHLRSPNEDAQAYGARIAELFEDTRTDRELSDYIILDKSEFPATNVINALHCLGVTPEKIVKLANDDPFFNAIVMEGGFLLDGQSKLTDDNMVQLFKILLFKDYEGQP